MGALLVVHLIICLILIVVILLQSSSGMDLGSAFGSSGTSDSVFGSQGSSGFLIKVTSVLAGLFLLLSILMSYTSSVNKKSVVDSIKPSQKSEKSTSVPIPVNK